jgi:hypothetical protein
MGRMLIRGGRENTCSDTHLSDRSLPLNAAEFRPLAHGWRTIFDTVIDTVKVTSAQLLAPDVHGHSHVTLGVDVHKARVCAEAEVLAEQRPNLR